MHELKKVEQNLPPVYLPQQESPSWVEGARRVTLAVLPFFTLHPATKTPANLGMSGIKALTSLNEIYHEEREGALDVARSLAKTALIVTIFACGVLYFSQTIKVLTAYSIIVEINKLCRLCLKGEKAAALKSFFKLIQNMVALIVMCAYGGAELALILVGLKALTLLISSSDKFQKQGWLDWSEAGADLLMAGVRATQGFCQLAALYFERSGTFNNQFSFSK